VSAGHVVAFCAVVQYEWLRGPRSQGEDEAVNARLLTLNDGDFGDVPGLALYQPR
jgi:hypothetical protein